jgi:hypothetical protein
MTSERQRCANQKNARRSTGPRTAAGKAKAAQNSLRHGLAIDIRSDSVLRKDIESLAQQYCEDAVEPGRFADAIIAAEAQFAINRVRQVRVAFLEQAAVEHPLESAEKLPQFDRYERRALSRRKKALRAFFRN